MIYEIRLKGRQKQGECSTILTMTFFVLVLMVLTVNLIPLVYVSAVKPMLSNATKDKTVTLLISAVLIIALSLFYSCMSLGTDRFMLKRAENVVSGAGDIFYYFAPKRAVQLVMFMVKFGLYKLLTFALLSIPFSLCGYIFFVLCSRGFSALVCGVFAVFSLVFLALSFITYSRINDTFFLVRYRYIKGDYLNFKNLLSNSQRDMTGKITKLRRLKGSFTGWFMLCFLFFPLPYVWCYYRQTKACFAIEEY